MWTCPSRVVEPFSSLANIFIPFRFKPMTTVSGFRASVFGAHHESGNKFQCREPQVRTANIGKYRVLSSDPAFQLQAVADVGKEKKEERLSVSQQNGSSRFELTSDRNSILGGLDKLESLWDDGHGTETVQDYFEACKDLINSDVGPPRWFCPVACGRPIQGSPMLLYLPGLDGTGMGLTLHNKALGNAFEVCCLHIPINERTPFEDLVNFVERTVRSQHSSNPTKPIYLVGDSFGGCLALAVAARNPEIDLILVLVNPATSFGRSQLQRLIPILEAIPDDLQFAVPYALSLVMGNPIKMAMVKVEDSDPPTRKIEQLFQHLFALLPRLSDMTKILPRDTLLWKLKLVQSASAYANSRLHAVRAEVLVLASGKDYILPSKDEAQRLKSSLGNCVTRNFNDNGHTLLLEDGLSLLTIIKGTCKYRRSRRWDWIADFIPPSMAELSYTREKEVGFFTGFIDSAFFSTLEDGKIAKGLAGVPDEGPVLLVGNHMLMGLELFSLVEAFLREKIIMVRGMTHPKVFDESITGPSPEFSWIDFVKVFGAIPVTPGNLYKALSQNSHVLLYPGGAREALHKKGEEHMLFWPPQQEFVRMAARFGAKIVPFGVVGEDDIAQVIFDYDEQSNVPTLSNHVRVSNSKTVKRRDIASGEVVSEGIFFPVVLPKLPGRVYYLFGKPIETKGREDILKDKVSANQLYLQIKSEVESNIAYLIKKREEDPYRSVIKRSLYQAFIDPNRQTPSFEP